MRHYLAILILFFFSISICNAQTGKSKNNTLSFELGKTGLIYNLTFDHRFAEKNFGARMTIGSNFAKYLSFFSTGAGGYYLTGKKKHLELGIDLNYLVVDEVSDDQKGIVLIYPNYTVKTFYASMNIGYRKYGQKSLFRAGVSPGFITNRFLPGGYISIGLRF